MRAYIEISSVVALTSRLSLAAVMNHPAVQVTEISSVGPVSFRLFPAAVLKHPAWYRSPSGVWGAVSRPGTGGVHWEACGGAAGRSGRPSERQVLSRVLRRDAPQVHLSSARVRAAVRGGHCQGEAELT